jgi:hypothetical protein
MGWHNLGKKTGRRKRLPLAADATRYGAGFGRFRL